MIVHAIVAHLADDGSIIVHVPSLREDFRLLPRTERALVKNQFIQIDISDDGRTCRIA